MPLCAMGLFPTATACQECIGVPAGIVTVPISVFIAIKRSKAVRPLFRKRSQKLAELNGFSEEMLSGLKTIKAYGREQQISEKFFAANTAANAATGAANFNPHEMNSCATG